MSDRLRHVLRAMAEPWAITPDGFETVCAIIDRRASGVRLSDEQIAELVKESRAEFEARHAAADSLGGAGGSGVVAVIPVYGTILPRPVFDISGGGGCSMTTLMDKIKAADADPSVSKILLDIDSPGGSAFLVPEAAQVIRECATPVTAIANPLCCSAAYYLGSQAREFVATPSAIVGSIGVFARHVDYSAALEMDGIAVTLISAGDNKTNGNPYEPLSDAGRAEIQESVDGFYDGFVSDVARGRGVSTDEVLTFFGQGKTFLAVEAASLGLVDRVATFDEVVSEMLGASQGGYGARAASMSAASAREWVIDHFGPDARISGECSCGRTMSGKPENGEYAYEGGTYGFFTCHDCKREWIAVGNGAMLPKEDSPATAEQPDGADKTVTNANGVTRYDLIRRYAAPFGSTGR